MSTIKEVESQLRKIKKEVRDVRKHNEFLLDRLEKAHDRNAELRKEMMTMTIEDVVKHQKELAEYQDRMKKDRELVEAFEKQSQVKLGIGA